MAVFAEPDGGEVACPHGPADRRLVTGGETGGRPRCEERPPTRDGRHSPTTADLHCCDYTRLLCLVCVPRDFLQAAVYARAVPQPLSAVTSFVPVAATVIELNSDYSPVCAPSLLAAPHVSTEIAGVTFGDQSNEPGICPRRRLSLNLLGPRKGPPHAPTFGFALQEGDRLVSFQAGARRVIRSWPHLLTSDCCTQAEDRHGGNEASKEAIHSHAHSITPASLRSQHRPKALGR